MDVTSMNAFAWTNGLTDEMNGLGSGVLGLARRWENGFSMVKNGLAKILFAGKNKFLPTKIGLCQNCHQSKQKLEPRGFLTVFFLMPSGSECGKVSYSLVMCNKHGAL